VNKLLLFSVFDSKAAAFLRPFWSETVGVAARIFTDAANDPQHEFCRHAEDYTLFQLASFDQVRGVVEPWVAPESVCTAVAVRRVAS